MILLRLEGRWGGLIQITSETLQFTKRVMSINCVFKILTSNDFNLL